MHEPGDGANEPDLPFQPRRASATSADPASRSWRSVFVELPTPILPEPRFDTGQQGAHGQPALVVFQRPAASAPCPPLRSRRRARATETAPFMTTLTPRGARSGPVEAPADDLPGVTRARWRDTPPATGRREHQGCSDVQPSWSHSSAPKRVRACDCTPRGIGFVMAARFAHRPTLARFRPRAKTARGGSRCLHSATRSGSRRSRLSSTRTSDASARSSRRFDRCRLGAPCRAARRSPSSSGRSERLRERSRA